MRRFAIDKARCYERRVTLTDQAADLEAEPAPSAADVAALNAEQHAAWRAWASLPEASRAVLWHVVVERQTPAELADPWHQPQRRYATGAPGQGATAASVPPTAPGGH